MNDGARKLRSGASARKPRSPGTQPRPPYIISVHTIHGYTVAVLSDGRIGTIYLNSTVRPFEVTFTACATRGIDGVSSGLSAQGAS